MNITVCLDAVAGSSTKRGNLSDISSKVKLAINIHLESVNATRNVRSKPLIRLFRLAGKAPIPVRYAFEDDVV
jgi:hypothetical protein